MAISTKTTMEHLADLVKEGKLGKKHVASKMHPLLEKRHKEFSKPEYNKYKLSSKEAARFFKGGRDAGKDKV